MVLLRVKNADFSRKFEEWYIKNPDECYGEMNYTNDEADIRTSWHKYQRMHNNGHSVFMNVFCVLAGLVVLVVNTACYVLSLDNFDVYYSVTSFAVITVVGVLIMLVPLRDAISDRRAANKRVNDILSSGFAGVPCGCRFYNNRVEYISCCEHVIYNIEDIEYIYECDDGLYFMLYGNGLRYIPARFFDREFAYLVTERLSVVGFDIYRRRQYMDVQPEAAAIVDFEPPAVELCEPITEFNYIIDRRSAMQFTGCGRMKLPEIFHFAAAAILGIFVINMIFFRDMGTALNWGILILDIIYMLICLMLHFSGIPLECDKYTGQYIIRFFEGHMSVISGSSVIKADYRNIHSAERRKGCLILGISRADGIHKLIIPDYAVPNIEEFMSFMQSTGILKHKKS